MIHGEHKDLVVLLADLDAENAIIELLNRHEALGVRPFTFDPIRHPGRDAGVRRDCDEFLRSYQGIYDHALVVFDYHGSGLEQKLSPSAIEQDRENVLQRSGWDNRAAVIVLAPELEIWVWSDSPHVAHILGWPNQDDLRTYLLANNWLLGNQIKPAQPKEAMEAALRNMKKPRSARYFSDLAKQVSIRRCQDLCFLKFADTLKRWFPL